MAIINIYITFPSDWKYKIFIDAISVYCRFDIRAKLAEFLTNIDCCDAPAFVPDMNNKKFVLLFIV